MSVVADASVLIALSNIGRLEILKVLFGGILVPKAVAEEYGEPLPEWVKITEVMNRQFVEILLEFLHEGRQKP